MGTKSNNEKVQKLKRTIDPREETKLNRETLTQARKNNLT